MHPLQPEHALAPTAWPLRLGRSAAAAVVCTVLAAGAHVTGGGHAPVAALVGVLLAGWALTAALAGRRLTTGQLVGLLVLAQVAVHVFSVSAPQPAGGGAMLAVHLLGTLLSALVLRRGEDVLWATAERLVLRWAPLLRATRQRFERGRAAWCRTDRRVARVVAGGVWSRGPPVMLI